MSDQDVTVHWDDERILQDLADLWAQATPLGTPAMGTGVYGVIANNAVSAIPSSWPTTRKRVEPDDTWEAWNKNCYSDSIGWFKATVVSGPDVVDAFAAGDVAYRAHLVEWWRLYHASTQQWAEWDEATGAWVESTDPTAQGSVVLPPAIPQEPEQMLLEGVLAELYDSANGSVAQERVGRLLARYQELTGKRAPEFLRGH